MEVAAATTQVEVMEVVAATTKVVTVVRSVNNGHDFTS